MKSNIYKGLIAPEHYTRIKKALWVFLWLIDNATDIDGTVLGGRQIPISEITRALGMSQRTARRHLTRLAVAGYIRLIRGNRGYRIHIRSGGG